MLLFGGEYLCPNIRSHIFMIYIGFEIYYIYFDYEPDDKLFHFKTLYSSGNFPVCISIESITFGIFKRNGFPSLQILTEIIKKKLKSKIIGEKKKMNAYNSLIDPKTNLKFIKITFQLILLIVILHLPPIWTLN